MSAAVRGVMEALVVVLPEKLAALRAATLETCEAIEAGISAVRTQRPAGVDFPPHPFPAIFDRYEIRDMFILPLDILANLGERDDIGFIRISPEAATYIEKPADKKLTGVRLGHFGGFLSREWRANDILWGRMDAAETIVKILLEGEDREVVRQQIQCVQEEIAREELPQLSRAASPDYKSYLEHEYRIGEQEMADLPADYRVNVVMTGGQVTRNIFRRLEQADTPWAIKSLFHYLGIVLGSVLGVVRLPSIAIWGRDIFLRRLATLFLAFLFGWSLLAFVGGLFGVLPLTLRTLAWEAILGLPFMLWVLLLQRMWGILLIVLLAIAGVFLWRLRFG